MHRIFQRFNSIFYLYINDIVNYMTYLELKENIHSLKFQLVKI
jgi:hypothetical protein